MRLLREALAFAALVFQIAVVALFWHELPARIPAHYGASGRPDRYGSPAILLLLLAVAIVIYGVFTAANFFPRGFNYPVAVTGKNRQELQRAATALLGWVKAEVECIFAWVVWTIIRGGLGSSEGLGSAFLPLTVGTLGATVLIGIVRMLRVA